MHIYLDLNFNKCTKQKNKYPKVLNQWLEEVYSITEGFDFGHFVPYHLKGEKLACNWKLIVDGALEGYHFKIAHAKTIGSYFLDNMSINLKNKLHSSIVFPKRAMKN